VTVTAAVVLWGAARTGVPSDANIDGCGSWMDASCSDGWRSWMATRYRGTPPGDVIKLLEGYRSKLTTATK
jgi:hypothetical protein